MEQLREQGKTELTFKGFSCCCQPREVGDHKVVAVCKGGTGDGSEVASACSSKEANVCALCR